MILILKLNSKKGPLSFSNFIFLSCFLPLILGASFAWAAQADSLLAGASPEVISAKMEEDLRKASQSDFLSVPEEIERTPSPKPDYDSKPFFVKKINLFGDLLLPEVAYQPILSRYEGREVTFKDVAELMDEVEKVFRAEGFLAVISLPPQKMENQEIKMELIISRMGSLTVEGNRWFNEKLVRRHWDIAQGEYLKYGEIRDAAIAMSGNPDRIVRPVLKAGNEQRTTDIVLKVEEKFPLHADFTFDNQGVKLTGKKRPGFTIRHNNFLGLDDTLLVGTAFSNRFGALFTNYSVPINTRGTSFTANFSHSQVNPKKEFESLGINSLSQTYGLGLRQSLIQNERLSIALHSNFNFKEKRTRILSAVTSWDKQRVLSLGGTIQSRDRLGGTSLYQDFSFGMPNRDDHHPLASRGGEHSFSKYHANLSRQLKLPWQTYLLANGELQLTPDRLLPSEQIFLGGAGSVRGYPESDYGADQGWILQLEYWIPTHFFPETWHLPWDQVPIRDRLKFFGFFDQGYGRVRDPQNTELRSSYLAGAGFGGDFSFRDNLSLRIEWGHRLGDRPATEGGDKQLHFHLRSGI